MTIPVPCVLCQQSVKNNQNALFCVRCLLWCHLNCTKTNQTSYESNCDWICDVCIFKELPFACTDHDDHELDISNSDEHNASTDSNPETHVNISPKSLNTSSITVPDVDEEIRKISNYKGLKLMHLNCASILKNIDELKLLHAKIRPDVFGLSETHINDLIHDSELKIDDYNIVRRDRDGYGGGVAVYIKSDLNYIARPDLMMDDLEILSIELQFTHMKNIILIVWYRPPSSSVQLFDNFQSILQKVDDLNFDYIILGDMNCNMRGELTSWQTKRLLDIIENYNLTQVIDTPTRVTNNTATTLDLIMTNKQEKVNQSGVFPISLSDHYLIYCTWGNKRVEQQKNYHKYKLLRNFKQFDVSAYITDVK